MTLPPVRTSAGAAGLTTLLTDPRNALVGLDFDGTLSPIVADPAAARLAAGGAAALAGLTRCFGHVAVVTGRPAGWLAQVAGIADLPGVLIAGQYGAQRWAAGILAEQEPAPGLAAVRTALPALVTGSDAVVEDKGLSLVVHTRRAGDPRAALAALSGPVRALAIEHGLQVHPGRYVLEIRAPGLDKGTALRSLMAETGAQSVLFAGDDVGDLPAFAAVEALRADGIAGLTVCSASAEAPAVAQRADLVVDGPAGVVALLLRLVAVVDAAAQAVSGDPLHRPPAMPPEPH